MSKASKKGLDVLVVGGSGFIGRHVVSALRSATLATRVMDLAPPTYDDAGLDWVTGSISDKNLVASAADGCKSVIFLAHESLPGSSQSDVALEVMRHVVITLQFAEVCKEMKVERLLFASSGGTVYGYSAPDGGLIEDSPTRPLNNYGVSKLSIEHYLRLMGAQGPMRTLCLRISNPYGEGQHARRGQGVIAAAMQHATFGTRMPIWGDGTIERDFLHVSDVAGAFLAGLTHDGTSDVINIGSGHARTINEVLDATRRHTSRDLDVDYQPDRSIDVHRNVLSIDRAQAELGWAPKIEFDEGMARTARWWRKQP